MKGGIFRIRNAATKEVLATSDSVGSAKNAARRGSVRVDERMRVEGMGVFYVYEHGRCVAFGRYEEEEQNEDV